MPGEDDFLEATYEDRNGGMVDTAVDLGELEFPCEECGADAGCPCFDSCPERS